MFWIAVCFSEVVLFDFYALLSISLWQYVLLLVGYFLCLLCSSMLQGVLLDELPHNISLHSTYTGLLIKLSLCQLDSRECFG